MFVRPAAIWKVLSHNLTLDVWNSSTSGRTSVTWYHAVRVCVRVGIHLQLLGKLQLSIIDCRGINGTPGQNCSARETAHSRTVCGQKYSWLCAFSSHKYRSLKRQRQVVFDPRYARRQADFVYFCALLGIGNTEHGVWFEQFINERGSCQTSQDVWQHCTDCNSGCQLCKPTFVPYTVYMNDTNRI